MAPPRGREGCVLAGFATVWDGSFGDRVLKSPDPVLVEFWAPWSEACRLADGPLEEAAASFGPRLRLLRLNVEDNPVAAMVYGVRRVPLLVLFQQGAEVDRWAGCLDREAIRRRLRAALRPARDGVGEGG